MRIAELVVQSRLHDLPSDALRIAKDLLFDVVGVTLAGRTQPAAEKVIDFVKRMGGNPEATVIGAGLRTSPWAAALANGTAGATLDYDDTTWHGMGHFSAPHLAALLALGEQRGVSGAALLEAHAIAFEAANKIGGALQPGQYLSGKHSTGTIGVLGATAGCAKLLDLDVPTTAMALGIAASSAGAIRGNFGTMTKGFHSGMAASNAVMCSLLAETGFTARLDTIETPHGFAATTVKDDSHRLDEVGLNWGNPWDVISPGLGIKFQPSGTMSFSLGQLAVELATENDIDVRSIESIHCRMTALAMELGSHRDPRNTNEAQYSNTWAVAVSLTDRKRGLAQFSDDRVKDEKVLALARKVHISLHPDLDPLSDRKDIAACELTVVMNDGRRWTKFQRRPKGYPGGEPWTADMLDEKFRDAARMSLSHDKVELARRMLREIESIADVRELTAVIRGQ
jgi:2-methylcitrate dehydratase PrpD